ncbi:MAG: sigma-70 family RNA polymerase sigma factor [Acutalibacter sp.]
MDTTDLLKAYKDTGDEAYKWELVLRYQGLVKSAALQMRGIYSSFAQVDDIVSEGVLTLLRAVDNFDMEKGVKFETYISKRIRGMIIDLARKHDWVPRNVRKRSRQINQAVSELYEELGRFPTDQEIADRLNIPVDRYQKDAAGAAMDSILSLDVLMDMRDPDRERYEVPSPDLESQPEVAFQERELQQALAAGIRTLRENEQLVLSLYYEHNLHMKEIAQVLEVSEPRVSQIHARAVQKLKLYMEQYMDGSAPVPEFKRKKEESHA